MQLGLKNVHALPSQSAYFQYIPTPVGPGPPQPILASIWACTFRTCGAAFHFGAQFPIRNGAEGALALPPETHLVELLSTQFQS